MGGVNHQPCNRYLPDSTRLSRALSLGRISFESANVALEDHILGELEEGSSGSMTDVLRHLQSSGKNLEEMKIHLSSIRSVLHAEGGWEPPTVDTIDWNQVGIILVGLNAVDAIAWGRMTEVRTRGGFDAIIENYLKQIDNLVELNSDVHREMQLLESVALRGQLSEAVEENRAGNFKIAFANLYHSWASFQQDFLASVLLSTESWYRWTNVGSMIEMPPQAIAA